ncbi:hypothetical protein OU529_19625, partial [Escherichia coli]|nr:hypothetical protein [Escherichia coli]
KRAYCLKTQPATGETYPKSDLFNKALIIFKVITLVRLLSYVRLLKNIERLYSNLVCQSM